MSKKKILITGGLGFIGSHLAEECIDAGHDVTILSIDDKTIANISKIKDKVKIIFMDQKDIKEEVKCFDLIFNLAGSTDNYSIIEGKPFKDIDLNCNTTIALLEACKEYNPKARIVFISTFFVNGNQEKLPVTPSSPCNPLGLYGATRLCAENFCHIYHNVFDLDIVIVRFSNVFGPRENGDNKKKGGFNYLIKLALDGKEINLYNDGDFYRDYIYVTDVAKACLVIAKKGVTDKTYYVSRGKFVKFKKLIDIVIKNVGKGSIKPIDPPDFHKRVGILDFVCDNTPLKNLGWKPEVTLEEGIKKTIEYYKEE